MSYINESDRHLLYFPYLKLIIGLPEIDHFIYPEFIKLLKKINVNMAQNYSELDRCWGLNKITF